VLSSIFGVPVLGLELNVARSVYRAKRGNDAPFFLDQHESVHRSWVPAVVLSAIWTHLRNTLKRNVGALVGARVTAHRQRPWTTPSRQPLLATKGSLRPR